MKKYLSTFEAMKANETKRVKPSGLNGWYGIGELIDRINNASPANLNTQWEVEDSPQEFFGLADLCARRFKTRDEAEKARLEMIHPSEWVVVCCREVSE